jgi:hypothetical protein
MDREGERGMIRTRGLGKSCGHFATDSMENVGSLATGGGAR